MPRSIRNPQGITLRKLIQNTYHHYRNRFDNRDRDVIRNIIVKKIDVYDGKDPGEARTTYRIITTSYPQYYPYYTRKDSRGRTRRRQRTYRHMYEIIIQLDELSLDSDRFKIRTGSDAKWDFSPLGKYRKDSRGRIIEGRNIQRGINGDFFFRLSWLYKNAGILYGRNYANGPPKKTNPKGILFLDKHMLRALEILTNNQIIQ